QNMALELKSIVFPRNQYNPEYIKVCLEEGITSYRGNENSWIYKPAATGDEGMFKRAFRLLDSYINISGHHTYKIERPKHNQLVNIPSSRFLRPYSPGLKWFEPLKLQRIKRSMTHAARENEMFH